VDNVFAAPNGDVYVAEDPGNIQLVALTRSGNVRPIVQVTGQDGSEVTGPALSPDGQRLYFSSQRNPGTTYELTGPFVSPLLTIQSASVAQGQLHMAAALAAWPLWRRIERQASS
jgi:secreted PhoX family phosphatase